MLCFKMFLQIIYTTCRDKFVFYIDFGVRVVSNIALPSYKRRPQREHESNPRQDIKTIGHVYDLSMSQDINKAKFIISLRRIQGL